MVAVIISYPVTYKVAPVKKIHNNLNTKELMGEDIKTSLRAAATSIFKLNLEFNPTNIGTHYIRPGSSTAI